VIPQTFEYSAPVTLQETLDLLEGGDRKVLAGGMSLIPLMKLRLASPEELVDLGRVPGLNRIEERNGEICIGAMATHHDIEMSPLIRSRCPLLAETASHIGDVQVRNVGTLGGSIAHADPAADYPAALVALEADVRLASARADRVVKAEDFFVDAFTTALEPGELVVEIHVPVEGQAEGYRYEKVAHPASGFAVVGVAARIRRQGERIAMARVGVTGLSGRAFRAHNVEDLLENGSGIGKAVTMLGEGEEPNSDLYASRDYRLHLARVHAARALSVALSRAS